MKTQHLRLATPLLAALAAAVLPTPTLATPTPATFTPAKAEKHVTIDLLTDSTTIVAGSTTTLGIRFKIESGWHIYWNGLNDTGFAPIVTFKGPTGATFDTLQWPTPIRHTAEGDILDHIYENEVILLTTVTIPQSTAPGELKIEADAKWLVCKEACVAESGSTSTTLTVVATKPTLAPEPTEATKAIEATRKRIPTPLKPTDNIKVTANLESLTISDPLAAEMTFFPRSGTKVPSEPIKECTSQSTQLNISLQNPSGADPSSTVNGVISIIRKDGSKIDREISVPLSAFPTKAKPDGSMPDGEVPASNPNLMPTEPPKKPKSPK